MRAGDANSTALFKCKHIYIYLKYQSAIRQKESEMTQYGKDRAAEISSKDS